jgi:hypothetical protein
VTAFSLVEPAMQILAPEWLFFFLTMPPERERQMGMDDELVVVRDEWASNSCQFHIGKFSIVVGLLQCFLTGEEVVARAVPERKEFFKSPKLGTGTV